MATAVAVAGGGGGGDATAVSTLPMDTTAPMMLTGVVSLDVRQMGDLTVQSARLIPEEMESGIWPVNNPTLLLLLLLLSISDA